MAKYTEVAEDLRNYIENWPIGSEFFSLDEIAMKYGCNKRTAQSAVSQLESLGLVETHQGLKAVVIGHELTIDPIAELYKIRDQLNKIIAHIEGR